jgi:acyl dehydratase/NADP-dependent 3-hydroxy acid dehydrogenase YdfG
MTTLSGQGARSLGHYRFSHELHNAFTSFSQDTNPIHIDPLTARKTLSGKLVVHGMHSLLAAMESWALVNDEMPTHIKCDFSTPVSVGDSAEFISTQISPGQWKIRVMIGSTPFATLSISTDNTETFALPVENSSSQHEILLGTFNAASMFPQLTARVGEPVVKALAACSYLVGMVCPGLFSIFSQLDVEITPASVSSGSLKWDLTDDDERFNLLTLSISGPVSGNIRAFRRPEPVKTPAIENIAQLIAPDEFRKLHALLVGGSRGIGACTAKILAAGGAKIVLSYLDSHAEATAICDELNNFHPGCCTITRLDVTDEQSVADNVFPASLNAVFYFATPRIIQDHSAIDTSAHNPFRDFYIDGMQNLCNRLEKNRTEKIDIFLPSTIFIEKPNSRFSEYTATKIAAEALADTINQSASYIHIIKYRLPAMETDQTVTPGARKPPPVLETILPYIRDFSQHITDGQ